VIRLHGGKAYQFTVQKLNLLINGGFFLSNRIDDAFVAVDTPDGAAGHQFYFGHRIPGGDRRSVEVSN
jgi:hypothetical protein